VAIEAASTFGVDGTSLNSPKMTSIGRSLSPLAGFRFAECGEPGCAKLNGGDGYVAADAATAATSVRPARAASASDLLIFLPPN
jgi:hypothetical protein